MIFQWDGFPLNEQNWNDNFLSYDFIGAPHFSQIHNSIVFNGGFSLRSPRLNNLLLEKYPLIAKSNLFEEPEDKTILNLLQENATSEKFKLPTFELARQFAFEHGEIDSPFFGFHGVFNFPFLFSEDILINLVSEFKERLNQPHILLHFLKNCLENNYLDFLKLLPEHGEKWSSLDQCIKHIHQNPDLLNLKNALNTKSSLSKVNNESPINLININNMLNPISNIPKLEIFDGDLKVSSISVIILVRNNATYLTKLFQMLSNLEVTYECTFEYLFLENSSHDHSVPLIQDFLKQRDGSITSLGNTSRIDEMPRTAKMAYLRNYSKNLLLNTCSSWSLLIDTDIYFDNKILSKLFKHSPSSKNIGMLCSNGLEIWPGSNSNEWICQNHYYDTFAFSINKTLFWPHCIFSNCVKCATINNTKIISSGLINTDSAFGGLALIQTNLLKNPNIRWGAIKHHDIWLCEHVEFGQTLKEISKKSISIATDCPVYWDASTFGV
jgi:hypothetical protein